MTDLIRPRRGRIIAGVCAGLALRFSLSPALVRLIFLLSLLLPGPQVLIYAALWIVVPKERGEPPVRGPLRPPRPAAAARPQRRRAGGRRR